MKYLLFIIMLFSFYACPPDVPEENFIRDFFKAIENGNTRWLDKHTTKDFRFQVTYLMDKEEHFKRPMEKHTFLSSNKSKERFKTTVGEIKWSKNGYKARVLKSQKVKLFLALESENHPDNSYALPFEYTFQFKDLNTLSFLAVDTIAISTEHFYDRWSSFQNVQERINPSTDLDSLSIHYKNISYDIYSYLLYSTNGWH